MSHGDVFSSYLLIFPATLEPFCQSGSQLRIPSHGTHRHNSQREKKSSHIILIKFLAEFCFSYEAFDGTRYNDSKTKAHAWLEDMI